MRLTLPLPYGRSAATTRSPVVGQRPAPVDELAGQGRQVGRIGRDLAEQAVERARRRRRSSWSAGRGGARPGTPTGWTDPACRPTMTRRPPPAIQPRSASSCAGLEARGVDVLPDQPVERAPRLDALRQVGGIQGDGQRRDVVLVRAAGRRPPTMSPGRSATTPTISWVGSWIGEVRLGRGERAWRPSTRAISSSRPNAGGCAYRR